MVVVDKLICFFLVVLFAFSAADKLLHVHGFINAINDYKLLPIPLGDIIAPLIIGAELAIAIGLMRRNWRRVAALQAAALMLLFTTAILSNRALGGRGVCGCWFSITTAQGDTHILFNLVVLALSLIVWHSALAQKIQGSPRGFSLTREQGCSTNWQNFH